MSKTCQDRDFAHPWATVIVWHGRRWRNTLVGFHTSFYCLKIREVKTNNMFCFSTVVSQYLKKEKYKIRYRSVDMSVLFLTISWRDGRDCFLWLNKVCYCREVLMRKKLTLRTACICLSNKTFSKTLLKQTFTLFFYLLSLLGVFLFSEWRLIYSHAQSVCPVSMVTNMWTTRPSWTGANGRIGHTSNKTSRSSRWRTCELPLNTALGWDEADGIFRLRFWVNYLPQPDFLTLKNSL